jgi:adenylate cyclase
MKSIPSAEEKWHGLVVEGDMELLGRKRLTTFYALLPTSARCRICNLPFAGLSGRIMQLFGKTSSRVNPHICSACDDFIRMNPGGVEIRLSMLFADIRGSTSLAERMKPAEFHRLIDRFYATATEVLCKTNALIDKLAGDQVSCYFVPGLAGTDHARMAMQAAQELLQATGHGEPGGPWIPVGIGVHTGEAFIGSVGTRGRMVDMTALGDAVNISARLASNAGPGEILISQDTYTEAGLDPGARELRQLSLKGRSLPVSVAVWE